MAGSLARSYLYVPGDRPDRFAKAAVSGADAVVLDLEDGVSPAGKIVARREVLDFERTPGPQWWVRVDTRTLGQDLVAAARAGTQGVFVPGAEVELLAEVDRLLGDAERAAELPEGRLEVIGLIETARGLQEIGELARSPRLTRLGIGEADLAAELGISPGPEREELWPGRFAVVVASAAAGIGAPVGPVETRLGEADVLAASTARLVRQGFGARTAIHPRQIDTIHDLLTPSEQEVASAREVVAVFEQADAEGTGVGVTADGRLVDLAVVRSARSVLARVAPA